MKLKRKEAVAGVLLALPCLIGFVVFYAAPFVVSLYYCFTRGVGGTEFVGFGNFVSLMNSLAYRIAVVNTLKFNVLSVPLIMAVSLFLAIILNMNIKGVTYFRSFFIFPLIIPVASVITVWTILFSDTGVVNGLLVKTGIKGVNWFSSGWAFVILVLIYVWKNCGYNMILFLAGLNNIPKEYYESAEIDGAGAMNKFLHITVPYLIPTGFFVFIISIINSFKVFREAYLLFGGAYPNGQDVYLLQHFMNNNFTNLNYQRLSTAAFIMSVVIVALVYIVFKFEKRLGRDMYI